MLTASGGTVRPVALRGGAGFSTLFDELCPRTTNGRNNNKNLCMFTQTHFTCSHWQNVAIGPRTSCLRNPSTMVPLAVLSPGTQARVPSMRVAPGPDALVVEAT